MSDVLPVVTRVDVQNIRRILNVLPSADPERDWSFLNAVSAGFAALLRDDEMPPKADLREAWWDIADQGTSGSCVGWTVADSLLRWHLVKAGKLKQNEKLSARFIWMAGKETDVYTKRPTSFIEEAPTSLKAGLDIARKFGAVKEEVLPFERAALTDLDGDTFYAMAAQLKISAYFNLGLNPLHWRMWLAKRGPVAIRLVLDDSFYEASAAKPVLRQYRAATAEGGHAIALVGFEGTRFLVRNSWGERWGEKGYAYVTEAYAKAAFKEAYGVVV